ncbi:uncharacterized protein BXZ73DRAFT_41227 [Epithele typhae]|uniref:uncharacterized protein n=1 Tax=Epithele typhae TaxID=378194 RepID=UPI0020080C05|nr:uncharacterized protein BXZ73DRAFT_41227 [Epithele typhae]KAH9942158.1 hypothetical protein BXZ73DRAFT_41227 [Epithele typhae]
MYIAFNFLQATFRSPLVDKTFSTDRLDRFIVNIARVVTLDADAIFCALYLLWNLKATGIIEDRASGHRLFLVAVLIAKKVVDDWDGRTKLLVERMRGAILSSPSDITEIEWMVCQKLRWRLQINPEVLQMLKRKLCGDFRRGQRVPDSYRDIRIPLPSRTENIVDAMREAMGGDAPRPPSTAPIESHESDFVAEGSRTPPTPALSSSADTTPATSPGPSSPAGQEGYVVLIGDHTM